ncbi:DMT family transporter [Peribacillus kribbensis]|uniref:DMT family transporter n=1 Tax=Peribacillus kribbensis TaxID=356658 RepID=UPI000419F5E8|nr:multidrug efflux SMR transporter [Peribacillus kribbensis]
MPWMYLVLAGASEVVWAFGLKHSHGFTEWKPSIIAVVFILISFILFSKAAAAMPVGTAYAVFTGIGAASTVIAGFILGEEISLPKIVLLLLLFAGIVGLKATTKDEEAGSDQV